jgi:hypothetical protein
MDRLDLNKALRIYLGSDPKGGVRPYGMRERVEAEFGAKSAEVVREIHALLAQITIPPEVAHTGTLQEIGALAEKLARAREPGLDDDACRAIGNYVSYGYR